MLKRFEVEVEVGNGREGCGAGRWPGGRGDHQVLARPPPAAGPRMSPPDPQLTNWHMGGWPHSGDQANTALFYTVCKRDILKYFFVQTK